MVKYFLFYSTINSNFRFSTNKIVFLSYVICGNNDYMDGYIHIDILKICFSIYLNSIRYKLR